MASVGLGMSTGLDQVDFAFCSFDFNQTNTVPASNGDGEKHNPAPLCPFCFIA